MATAAQRGWATDFNNLDGDQSLRLERQVGDRDRMTVEDERVVPHDDELAVRLAERVMRQVQDHRRAGVRLHGDDGGEVDASRAPVDDQADLPLGDVQRLVGLQACRSVLAIAFSTRLPRRASHK